MLAETPFRGMQQAARRFGLLATQGGADVPQIVLVLGEEQQEGSAAPPVMLQPAQGILQIQHARGAGGLTSMGTLGSPPLLFTHCSRLL